MALAHYRVVITDHDHFYTRYTAVVEATSKPQAIAKGAALIGAEKAIREYQRHSYRKGAIPHYGDAVLLEPEVKLEVVGLDEFWEQRDRVTVSED